MTGSILRGIGSFYTVLCDEDGQEYTLRAQKKLRHQKMTPMVGDRVRFTPGQGEEDGWLEEILPELGISAHCVTARAEEAVASCRESFDVASSRAVARLNILLELLAPYVKVGGYVAALKGAAAQEELDECKNAIKLLGLRTESVTHFDVDGADHAVILLKKIAPTPARFPRRYAKIKQSPL